MRPQRTASRSDTHRHHSREELTRAGRLDDRGVELAAEAELHFVFVERAEDIKEILGVEADGHVGPRVLDGYLVGPFTAVGRLGGDPHRALGQPELHATGALARRHGHCAKCLGERGTRHPHELLALLRNDLRVRRKLSVDQAHRERHSRGLEERARAALGDLELGFRLPLFRFAAEIFGQAAQLLNRLERDEHRGRGLTPAHLDLHLREAMAIGRHHADDVPVPLEERRVQVRPGLVARDREVRLVDELAKDVDVEGQRRRPLGRARQGRKVVAGHSAERVTTRGPRGLYGRAGVVLRRQVERAVGHHADALEQIFDRYGHAAALADVDGHVADQRQVQVGGCHPEGAGAIYREEHVRENGHRALTLGDALHARDQLQQISLGYGEFHPAVLAFASLDEIYRSVDRPWGGRGECVNLNYSSNLDSNRAVECEGERLRTPGDRRAASGYPEASPPGRTQPSGHVAHSPSRALILGIMPLTPDEREIGRRAVAGSLPPGRFVTSGRRGHAPARREDRGVYARTYVAQLRPRPALARDRPALRA